MEDLLTHAKGSNSSVHVGWVTPKVLTQVTLYSITTFHSEFNVVVYGKDSDHETKAQPTNAEVHSNNLEMDNSLFQEPTGKLVLY